MVFANGLFLTDFVSTSRTFLVTHA
jgi:hypothetical protein